MEKKINKKNVVQFAAAGLLTVALGTGIGLHIVESNADHLNEYCPLNDIFGAQHQVHVINREYAADGITAYYAENGEAQLVSAPMKTENDGKTSYWVPSGYIFSNGQGVKNIKYPDGEDRILITQGTPIYPEGAQPGDLIKISDIQVYDPQIIKVITDNQENRSR